MAEPCFSCGRSDQPERFHTHPAKQLLAKSPLKESKHNNNNNNSTVTNNNSNNSSEAKEVEQVGVRGAGGGKGVSRSLSPRKPPPQPATYHRQHGIRNMVFGRVGQWHPFFIKERNNLCVLFRSL